MQNERLFLEALTLSGIVRHNKAQVDRAAERIESKSTGLDILLERAVTPWWRARAILRWLLILCFVPWALSGCGETTTSNSIDPKQIMEIRAPDILSSRIVNPDNLDLELRVNGRLIQDFEKSDNTWTAKFIVPPDQATFILLLWYEDFQRYRRLDLAQWSETVVFNTNETIFIDPEQFETEGVGFDADGDGVSNLAERNARTNPFDELSFPAAIPAVDVIIPVIRNAQEDPSVQPIIDGSYDPNLYAEQNAQFEDTTGAQLSIDNLMLIDGVAAPIPPRSDGNTEMRWFTMHDGTYLYLFVVGEQVNISNPNADSTDFLWNDDNLTIYLDGNNSKQSGYDGIDDIRIEIPLLDSAGNANSSNSPDKRIKLSSAAPDQSTIPPPRDFTVEFAVCKCDQDGQHTWEIKIPMAPAGLRRRSAFGLDLHIDLDHDGQDRDVRWGWFHPAGSDTTWFDPSAMATGWLQ